MSRFQDADAERTDLDRQLRRELRSIWLNFFIVLAGSVCFITGIVEASFFQHFDRASFFVLCAIYLNQGVSYDWRKPHA